MKRLRDLERLKEDGAVEINMSPLIDMVFLLLIFFMVTSVFVQQSAVDVERPTASSAKTKEGTKLIFSIDSAGKIYFENDQVNLMQVRAITNRKLVAGNTSVVVLADKASHTGTLMDVIDECKLAGANNVSIAAEKR